MWYNQRGIDMSVSFESNYYRIETSKPMSKLMNMCNRVSFDYDLCTLLTMEESK